MAWWLCIPDITPRGGCVKGARGAPRGEVLQLSKRVYAVPCELAVTASCMLQGLFVAAETILNTIVLLPAIDDAGGAGSGNDDYTQVRPRTYFSNTPVRVARFGGQVVVLGLGCLIKKFFILSGMVDLGFCINIPRLRDIEQSCLRYKSCQVQRPPP